MKQLKYALYIIIFLSTTVLMGCGEDSSLSNEISSTGGSCDWNYICKN